MNARLYDPELGRFLSPDPYVQAPDWSQSFNRYAYCWNNPLKYTDPDGESILLAGLIGAFVGVSYAMLSSDKGGLERLGDFGKGFLIGAASGIAGVWGGTAIGGLLSPAMTFGGSVANGAIVGGAGGFAGGFVNGAGFSWITGESLATGFNKGLAAGGAGALVGSIAGGIGGGIRHQKQTFLFSKGLKNLGVDGSGPVPATDKFLNDAQKAWYPDAPMGNVDRFTVENVPAAKQITLDNENAGAMTVSLQSGGRLNGNSRVYFNKNIAFSSAKHLFYIMGHEFVHVSQYALLAGKSSTILRDISPFNGVDYTLPELMEFHAYSYQHSLGGIQLSGFTSEGIKAMAILWPGYFKTMAYMNMPWTKTAVFKYPF